jgi:copper resistance protein B
LTRKSTIYFFLDPYIGVRYRFLAGETADIAEASGADTTQWFFMAGIRFAF